MLEKKIARVAGAVTETLKKKNIDFEKIVIYGSYIRKASNLAKDIDLIIVSKNFRHKDIFQKVEITKGVHRELIARLNKPIDIRYYSDFEWQESTSPIMQIAKSEGIIFKA